MGVLAQRLESRGAGDKPEWLTADDDPDAGRSTASGIRVTQRVALGLTTIWRCVDLLSSAVSQAPKDIILKLGGRSYPEYGKPSWLVMPNPANPAYTANDYFSQVAISLLIDGNYFVLVMPSVDDPVVMTVLMPTRVEVKSGPIFSIKDAYGREIQRVGPDQMLHGTWIQPAGELRGISPLEVLRRAIGNAVGAEDHAGRFFGQGAALSFGVEVPGPLTPDQKSEMAQNLRARYAGAANSHAIGVLTSGAKFVSGLAPTPEQAQMLATRKFSVEDLCRPYGVPPNMAGSQEPGASSYASADVWRDEFRDYAVLPLATRIEAQHNRLVRVPDTITDATATAQFKINLDHVARTSLLTRYQAYFEGIRGGILTPHEVRTKEDLPPNDPNASDPGDKLYMLQQMVPLADLGKTKATEPLVTQPAPAGEQKSLAQAEDERRFREALLAWLGRSQPPMEIHNHSPEVVVKPVIPPTVVNVPTPVVHVQAPVVNLAPPDLEGLAEGLRVQSEAIRGSGEAAAAAIREITEQREVPVIAFPERLAVDIVSSPKEPAKRTRVTARDAAGRVNETVTDEAS